MGNDGKEGAVWPPVGKQTTARLAKPGLQPPPGVEHSRGPWTVVFARGGGGGLVGCGQSPSGGGGGRHRAVVAVGCAALARSARVCGQKNCFLCTRRRLGGQVCC